MSVEGRWSEMGALVPDDVVRIFAACGTYQEIAGAIERRYGGVADSIDLEFPEGAPVGLRREVLGEIRKIPRRFVRFGPAPSP
jgi:hypothetical protein